MNLKNKRIFVSGGNGVIGNELVLKLHDLGATLLVGDLKPRPEHWAQDIVYRQGDLNFITPAELLNFQPEYFFHLAATFERSTESYDFWEENFAHNVTLSNYLMTILKDCHSLKKVVFASSYLIYDPNLYNFTSPKKNAYRLKETDPIYPRNLTGVAKLSHEIELRFLNEFKKEQFQTVCARIYRSYGKFSRDIISRWIRSLLNNEKLTVYKKEGKFDYIYAGDVAEGLIKLGFHEKAEGIYNLGNDNARSVAEVLNILRKYFPTLSYDEVENDILYEASQANMDTFFNLIGWKPQQQLENIIPILIEHEKNNNIHEPKKKQQPSHVLLTSLSKKISCINAIKNAGKKIVGNKFRIFGADINPNALGKYFVDDFWKMPSLDKITVPQIIEYCKANHIVLVVPSRDGELLFWSNIKNKLAQAGIHVMVSDSDVVSVCLDKLMFFEHLNTCKLPAIYTSNNLEEIKSNLFVVKERYGAGSQNIGLKLSKQQAIEKSKQLTNPVFQPFIEGTEFSIDAYIDKKKNIKGIICRTREEVTNGESQITTSVNNLELEEMTSKVIHALNLYGHVVLQVLIDKDNQIHIIECNSRFGGASSLSVACGLDSFYWAILEAMGVDVSSYPFHKSSVSKKQIRYANDLIV